MKHKILNGLMFNTSWLLIILAQNAWLSWSIAALHLTLHALLVSRRLAEWRFVVLFSVCGLLIDQLLFVAGVLQAPGSSAYAPLWLSALWPVLATTALHAFSGLAGLRLVAVLFGVVGGYASYRLGVSLSLIEYGPLPYAPLLIAALWGLLFPTMLLAAQSRWATTSRWRRGWPGHYGMLLMIFFSPMTAEAAVVVGEARAIDDGELRYIEYHHCSVSGEHCEVCYRDTDNVLFAHKTLDYSRSFRSPALLMEDLRQGKTLRVIRDPAEGLVVDAGFDHYVREQWEALAAGNQVNFTFLVAGRSAPLNMRAQLESKLSCAQDRLCLKIELDNWLISALTDPIRLQYDRQSRQLLQFSGVSNIQDARGRPQQVSIEYRYPSPEEWRESGTSAEAGALQSCRL